MNILRSRDKECLKCGKEFRVEPHRVTKAKYCSQNCYHSDQRGISMPDKFHEAKAKWFKENKDKHVAMLKARGFTNENNPFWKGDAITYSHLHRWIRQKIGKPELCEHCGSTCMVEWANKSREYKRDLDDWLGLCRKCHAQYDTGHSGAIERRFPCA